MKMHFRKDMGIKYRKAMLYQEGPYGKPLYICSPEGGKTKEKNSSWMSIL